MFTRRPYVAADDAGLQAGPDPRDLAVHGLLVAFLLPVAVFAIGALVALAMLDNGAGEAALVPVVLAALPAGLAFVVGAALVALAPSRARRQQVRVSAHDLSWPDGRTLPRERVARVAVAHPNPLLKWWALQVVDTDGKAHALVGRVPPSRIPDANRDAALLAEHLGVPVEEAPRPVMPGFGGMRPETVGAFCYIPLQGIGFLASVLALVFARDPRVRFCAKQSLTFFIGSGMLLVAVVVVAFLPIAIHESPTTRGIAGAIALVGLLPVALARFIVMVVAGVRAYGGRLWVIPGLGWLVRRWLPAQPTEE